MEHINPVEFTIAMLARNARHEDGDFEVVNEGDGYELHEVDPNKPKYFDPKKAEFANDFVKRIKKLKDGKL